MVPFGPPDPRRRRAARESSDPTAAGGGRVGDFRVAHQTPRGIRMEGKVLGLDIREFRPDGAADDDDDAVATDGRRRRPPPAAAAVRTVPNTDSGAIDDAKIPTREVHGPHRRVDDVLRVGPGDVGAGGGRTPAARGIVRGAGGRARGERGIPRLLVDGGGDTGRGEGKARGRRGGGVEGGPRRRPRLPREDDDLGRHPPRTVRGVARRRDDRRRPRDGVGILEEHRGDFEFGGATAI